MANQGEMQVAVGMLGKIMARCPLALRSPKSGSLVERMTLGYLFWAFLAYLAMVAGFWWSSNYLVEEGLKKQAVSWAGEFDELGTPLYFSDMPVILEQVRNRARHSPDIMYARYYEADSMKILGQYVKKVTQTSSSGWLSADQVNALQLDRAATPLVIAQHSFLTISSIRVLAPIQTRSLPVDSLFELGSSVRPGIRKTIGYLEIGVDLAPSRALILKGMLVASLLLGAVLLAAVLVARYFVRSAMKPLLNLQAPLARLANGELDVEVADDSAYKEIAIIKEAMRVSIAGLRQRDLEMEIAMRGKLHAELASEAKSQFLAHLSHEVRTPLNGILGFLGLLAKTPLNDAQRAYLHDVDISSQRLMAMINDILDFSKIEAGKLALEHAPFDLRETMEECLALYSANAHAKQLDMILLFARGLPTELVGDAGRIAQVLGNLLANAVKFTHRGEIEVTAELIEASEQEITVRIMVSDSGIGIAPDEIGKLFKPFSQADHSITRRYGGSGLGLVISRKLVEMMGGRLEVESLSGTGSTFCFGIRLQKRVDAGAVPPSPALRDRAVLIVSPSDAMVDALREDLLAWGMEDDAVADGEGALSVLGSAAADGHAFDYVIVDDAVRDMKPAELVARIRADDRLGGLHALLLVNPGRQEVPDDRNQALAAAVLNKPVKMRELFAALTGFDGDANPCPPGLTCATASHTAIMQSMRILVVDDDSISRKLITVMLGDAGIPVDQAQNGIEAVEACRAVAYDLVLMDIQMPEMDGLAATREIRGLGKGKGQVPIVALTANALRGDRERYIEAGMSGYLAKPVNEKNLFETLAGWGAKCPPSVDNSAAVSGKADTRMQMLLGMLAKDLPDTLQFMEAACAEGRMDEVGRLAHRLRGGALYCQLPELQSCAEILERVCMEGESGGRIRRELDRLQDEAAIVLRSIL